MYLGPLAVRHDYARNFAAAAEKFRKPAAAIMNLSEADVRDIFQAHHIPVFDAATDACFKVLRAHIDYGDFLARRRSALKETSRPRRDPASIDAILQRGRGALLPQPETAELLGLCGFDCAAYKLASGSGEAIAAAHKLGYPVIIKAGAGNVAHRSDAGLVSGRIANDDALREEFAKLESRARALGELEVSVSIERFIPHDLEIILGVKYDPTFGPVILCGLGGIFTEVLKDYALRLAPLSEPDVADMLSSLKAFPVLQKAEANGSPYTKVLSAALMRLSDLAVGLSGKISAVDINPIVLPSGASQLQILDAKIHL
jgi:acetyltransferase